MTSTHTHQPDALSTPLASPLIITDAAAIKIQELVNEEGDPNLRLRISIVGGGCSGFQYQFSFDDQETDEDVLASRHVPNQEETIGILVNMMSLTYLDGATVDYKNDVNGERFVITNPHAKTTCGCGSSFDA